MSSSLQNISAMSLFVEDLPETKSFYQDVFGVPVVYEDDVSAAMKFDNLIVNLLESTQASDLVTPGTVGAPAAGARFQLSIWVEDLEAVCIDLEKRGVRILRGPVTKPWGVRVATFTDPDGHNWEVAQRVEG